MGSIIDTDNSDNIYKCNDVKSAVILINLIGAPLSFILLAASIIRMIITKKFLSFLTRIIILIFSSEILNSISKLLQLLKYNYEAEKTSNNNNNIETPRGIICVIQIILSIISDFGSLLGTLLISIRCYDVIKKRRKFFDKKIVQVSSFFIIIISSVILSFIFVIIDMKVTSSTFKYDNRDKCNYWCWLGHIPSMICYSIYMILVIINLILACRTYYFLKREYEKLSEPNMILMPRRNSSNLEEKNEKEIKLKHSNDSISSEDTTRIKELELMKMKVLIYPWITIIIWILLLSYRLIDAILIKNIEHENEEEVIKAEKEYFLQNPDLRIAYEIFLILHTILSSIRGIIYGLTFIIFKENVFCNCFRRFINCLFCDKFKDPQAFDEDSNEEFLRNRENTLTSRNTGVSLTELVKNENNEEMIYRKSNVSNFGKNTNEMNE